MPVAAVPNPNVVPVDPAFTGITLIDDSITSYHYIPKFSWVHYTSFSGQYGVVEITTYPDAGYNQSEVMSYTELGYPDINLPKNIEIPNGAIVSREFINTPYSAAKEQDPRSERFFRQIGLTGETYPNTTVIGTYNNETVFVVTWDDNSYLWDNIAIPTDVLERGSYRLSSNKTPSWVEWAELSPNTPPTNPHDANYTAFTAEWVVPKAPVSHVLNARTNIFNGFTADGTQPNPHKGGVVQPSLAWNCGDRNGKNVCSDGKDDVQWTGMAGTCYGPEVQKPHFAGKQIPVSTGDTIRGSVIWDEKQDGWNVSLKDLTTGQTSHIVSKLISNKQADLTPVLTLENDYNSNICQNGTFKEEWPQSSTLFNNIVLKRSGGQLVPFDAKPNYNIERFTNPDRNALCGNISNYPQYNEPNHYYVDIGPVGFIGHARLNPEVCLQAHLWPREINRSPWNATSRPGDTPSFHCCTFDYPKPIEKTGSAIVAAVTREVHSADTPSPKYSDESHTNPPITGLTLVEDSRTSYHLIPKYSHVDYYGLSTERDVMEVATYQNAEYDESRGMSRVVFGYPIGNFTRGIEIPNGFIISREIDKTNEPNIFSTVNVLFNNETILTVTWNNLNGYPAPKFYRGGLEVPLPLPPKEVPVPPEPTRTLSIQNSVASSLNALWDFLRGCGELVRCTPHVS
jgi:hypothetical protein